MSAALTMVDVVKRYGLLPSSPRALDGLSLEVPEGSLCGFVGPNGAGKTTTFSVVCGFLRLTSGKVDILGGGLFDAGRLKGRLAALPQDADLGPSHTPRQLLTHLAQLQGLSASDARHNASQLLERVQLGPRMDDRITSLSHGMRRRVAVASSLLGDPELVLLDEPLSGLDPKQVANLRDFLAEQRGKRTLVVSSHNLAELEKLCDHVIIIDAGRLVRQGPIDELTGRNQEMHWVLGLDDTRSPQEGAIEVSTDGNNLALDALQARLPSHRLTLRSNVLKVEVPSGNHSDEASIIIMEHLSKQRVAVRSVSQGKGLERSVIEQEPPASGRSRH